MRFPFCAKGCCLGDGSVGVYGGSMKRFTMRPVQRKCPIVLRRKSQLSPGMCQGYSGSPVTKENVPERNAAAEFLRQGKHKEGKHKEWKTAK